MGSCDRLCRISAALRQCPNGGSDLRGFWWFGMNTIYVMRLCLPTEYSRTRPGSNTNNFLSVSNFFAVSSISPIGRNRVRLLDFVRWIYYLRQSRFAHPRAMSGIRADYTAFLWISARPRQVSVRALL